MDNKKTYIHILLNTLTKKSNILDQLIFLTVSQKDCLALEPMNFDTFDEIVDKKATYIEQLNQLDEGFDTVYTRVKEKLKDSKNEYQQEILSLQEVIAQITDKSVQLQSLEVQNKLKFDIISAGKKSEIKAYKVNAQSASKYYKNMSNQISNESYFVDKIK